MLLASLCNELSKKLKEIERIKKFPHWMNDSCIAEIKYSHLILKTILSIFRADFTEELNQRHLDILRQFLDNRWQRIMNTNLAYPNANLEPITNICLYIAKIINSNSNNNAHSVFKILMPTIMAENNALSLSSLYHRDMLLNHFVLTDDNARYIDVLDCLNMAENDGVLKETAVNRPLSPTESNRIICHSNITKAYYKLIILRKTLSQHDNSIGKRLESLYEKLTQSSTREGGEGLETKAGQSAYDEIIIFGEWLLTISEEEKKFLFSLSSPRNKTKNFAEIWQHLTQNYNSPDTKIDCTNILSFEVQHILEDNPKLYGKTDDGKTILDLNAEIKQKQNALEKALGKATDSMETQTNYIVNSGYNFSNNVQFNPPEFLYSSLSESEQVLNVIKLLPEKSQLTALLVIADKFWHQIQWQASDFVKIIKLLSIAERYLFLSKNYKKVFSTLKDDAALIKILSYLSQADIKDFFAQHHKYFMSRIKTSEALIRILKKVDKDLRKTILIDIAPELPKLITNPDKLRNFLKLFSVKQRIAVLECVFDNVKNFNLSLAEVNRCVLLIENNDGQNKKAIKKTLSALEAYSNYPSTHKKLLSIVTQAFQKDRIQKKAHSFFGDRYNPEKDSKIKIAKELDSFLNKKQTFFATTKSKGRIGAIIKHVKNFCP